jgi:cytoskeletal protein CcmA (bactofilin family)
LFVLSRPKSGYRNSALGIAQLIAIYQQMHPVAFIYRTTRHGADLCNREVVPLTMALDKKPAEDKAKSLDLADPPGPVTIRRTLRIKGEVIGSESLIIEGNVEGIIMVPNCRVTVGQHAAVFADIAAREVIVLGRVLGNINATDRVELRSEGSLTGVVTTKRIQITEGAQFNGGLNIISQGQ